MTKTVVIARHEEHMTWCRLPHHVVVLNKSGVFDSRHVSFVHQLPNVGREAHSYLWWIVNNYERLADVTVFLQGSPLEHFTEEELHRLLNHDTRSMVGLNMIDIMEWDESGQLTEAWRYAQWARKMRAGQVRRAPLSFGAWHDKHVCTLGHKVRYYMGAMFAVHRDVIRRRSVNYYETLLEQISDHVDPEESYYLERAWPAVFMAQAECNGLNGESLAIGNHKGLGRIEVC